MKHLLLSLLIFGFGISGSLGQTIKTLGYNTTNGQVVYSGTNPLVLPNNSIINGYMEVNVIRPIGGGGGIFVNDGIFQDTSGVGGESFNWGTGDLEMGVPISFATTNIVATTRTNLGLGWSALTNTNVTNFRSAIGLGVTNNVFFNQIEMADTVVDGAGIKWGGGYKIDLEQEQLIGNWVVFGAFSFNNTTNAATTRANLGFSTNLNTLWTATNASDARSAVGLGATNNVVFNTVQVAGTGSPTNLGIMLGGSNGLAPNQFNGLWGSAGPPSVGVGVNGTTRLFVSETEIRASVPIDFNNVTNAATTRTNLGLGLPALTNTNVTNFREAIGLGTTNTVTFSNLVINGNFTNNGTIYGLKTNVGPFEGIGNFFASNNTAVGNETLFRVGVAETTNKSAQFGFRVARTNNGGEGLAVFSVFGYNALMMIGPSDRSRSNSLTNTNAAIEADIWTMHETNRVMTLRDTNTGATVMHRPIGFNTNEVSTTAPSNTTVTNPTGWIQIYVGTNSVRVPYYQ